MNEALRALRAAGWHMLATRATWIQLAAYAVCLAAGAFLLQWLEYQHLVRTFSTELYVVLIAAVFTGLGAWVGTRLTPGAAPVTFERNEAALKSLGVTDRELAVLELLAAGDANKEIARKLDISPNTVKTHISSLFAKMEVQRRTQAIQKARELRILR